jgi:iron complex outermembrane recepter protein
MQYAIKPFNVLSILFFIMFFPVRELATAQSADVPAAENAAGQTAEAQTSGDAKKLADLDIEQLAKTPVVVASMDIPVTSVTKQESTVGHSAAAIFVITPEMIRRSGATCIPETLRMVPGMEVAHIDSNKWAITCRGFNGRYANKLLVLIDGRTIYTPVFSGVYWDMQDVLLEDIERIEVIRGPGGTLWGANAVNGVINIITKKAKDTQGAYVMAGGGTEEKFTDAVRYGGKIGDDGYYRIYGRHFDRGTFYSPIGEPDDAWRQGRFGFRSDLNLDRDKSNTLTVQGDCYTGASGYPYNLVTPQPPYVQSLDGKEQVSGENVLARLRHTYDEDSDWSLQMYFDEYHRDGFVVAQEVKTFDVDFQYRFPMGERQKITCGAGFRGTHDNLPSTDDFAINFTPIQRTYNLTSQFIQDEISLIEDRLYFTLGTKLEQNDFTGLEVQPSARLLWAIDRRHSAWGAVSRAVRTPSRADDDIANTLPPIQPGVFPRFYGSRDFLSEELMAYELGYRAQTTDQFSWDIAAFYNVYDRLRSVYVGGQFPEFEPVPPHLIVPLVLDNETSADTYGVELSGNWSVSKTWRLYGQYTYFHMLVENDPFQLYGGVDPHNQVYMRSSWDLGRNLDFDLIGRYVDNLPGLDVPNYISMDLRLGWRPRKQLEMAIVGQNLLQNQHQEYNSTMDNFFTPVTYVPRGVYGTLTWKF